MRRLAWALALLAIGCGEPTPVDPQPDPGAEAGAEPGRAVTFRDVTADSGIRFRHENGATPQRTMIETMGAGVAVLDYDGDGLQDLYFVDSGPVPRPGAPAPPGGSRLYRNRGGLRFEDVTAEAGVAGRGYGMGAVVGDYDADGHPDLYVTAFGENTLYRNLGDGRFADVTARAGVNDPRWSTGAAFLDFDVDGRLDLLVQNYVDYAVEDHRPCYQGDTPIYCTPDVLEGVPASLFRNRGDGTFEDVSVASGVAAVAGKGLGTLAGDLDGDGLPDLYLANDTLMNFLFHNADGRRFEEMGLWSGAGYSVDGREDAGMGVDAADFDGDGRTDLVVTNFQRETNALYRNEGGLAFTEVSRGSGTAAVSLGRLGFGVRFFDYDDDGIQDLVVANGHVYDNAEALSRPAPYAQPPTLFRGLGDGRFADVTERAGAGFATPRVGRGLALADLDEDGDLDLVMTANGGPAALFENVGGNARSWISVRAVGTKRDATAIGAVVEVSSGGRVQRGEVRSGGSYLSQSDLRLFFGLGASERVDRIRVRWPGGAVEEARDLAARRHLVFVEGEGLRR